MTQEALRMALDALEANDQLINGTGTNGGLLYCIDGYYSDCFDVDPVNKQTEEAINALKEALADHMREVQRLGQEIEQERNFCPRCGKRTKDLITIHTCTPPKD
jgi:hypothetical protein